MIDTLDAVTQAYASLDNATPSTNPVPANTFISPADPSYQSMNDVPATYFDNVNCEFIAKVYELYFVAKVIHWNAVCCRALHTDTDAFIKILAKFIDEFVELSLANVDLANMTVNPITFLTAVSNSTMSCAKWLADNNNGVGVVSYAEAIERALMLLTIMGKEVINNSMDVESKKLAKSNLLDDTIEKLTKLLYLSMKM